MESLSDDLFNLLRNLGTQLPSLLTLLICLVIALVRWQRHPRVSLIAALGLIFLILHGVVFAAAYVWVPRWFITPGSYQTNQSFYTVFGVIYNILFSLALGVLLVAVFIQRKPVAQTP